MHPCGRFGVLISQDIRYLRVGVCANALAGSASKAITYRVVEKAVRVKVWACCSVKP